MNKLSEITLFIHKLLRKQKTGKTMPWITERTCIKFLGSYSRRQDNEFHRKVWNAVNNGCVFPTKNPRFMKRLNLKGKATYEIHPLSK
jgi:hypothetical protein